MRKRDENPSKHARALRAWRSANPDKVRKHNEATREYHRKWRRAHYVPYFNRTEAQKESARKSGRNWERKKRIQAAGREPIACDVCGQPHGEFGNADRLHWDHDHHTGKFRGWLCCRCNTVLGRVRDSSELLQRLAAYLKNNNAR